jgi:hypothetical protein
MRWTSHLTEPAAFSDEQMPRISGLYGRAQAADATLMVVNFAAFFLRKYR